MPEYLIGIDVGGTNTDSVLLEPSKFKENKGVVSWNKSVTTPDVSVGIDLAIGKLFEQLPETAKKDVKAITIGTTHFINAVIEQDKSRLEKVAIFRLCGPYTVYNPPFLDWPEGLSQILDGYTAYIRGGNRIDGQEIRKLDEKAIREHCAKVKELGIKNIAVIGIFANLFNKHELETRRIIQEELGEDFNIILSHEVSGINFLERENASILNASIINFAKKIIQSFVVAVVKQGLRCPIFLTQNNGTILTTDEALKTPIRTFSSGATNSMRGASFLCEAYADQLEGKSVIVGDVGGTTLDVGLLLPSKFPRLSSSYSTVGGVRMNFSMPFVESIGLGGGSIVRYDGEEMTIGPDSVGADIVTRALVFGGDTVTTSDVTAFKQKIELGDTDLVKGKFDDKFIKTFNALVIDKLERVVDKLRTSPEPLPVILVGGGSSIIPYDEVEKVEGASIILKPDYYQVANAIGAAMGKLSAEISKVMTLSSPNQRDEIVEQLKEELAELLVSKGAVKESIEMIDIKFEPLAYVANTYTFELKAVGDVDYSRMSEVYKDQVIDPKIDLNVQNQIFKDSSFKSEEKSHKDKEVMDHTTYKPFVNENREWILSVTDLEYLRIGAYYVGCGGGGNPYSAYLMTKKKLEEGDSVKVIDYKDTHKYVKPGSEGCVHNIVGSGAPTVGLEQLQSDASIHAIKALENFMGIKADAVISSEIGGGNIFKGIWVGLKNSGMDLPVLDCDLYARLYPTSIQTIPVAYTDPDGCCYAPSCISDGNGNTAIVPEAQSNYLLERVCRTSLTEMGSSVASARRPLKLDELETLTAHNTMSQCWRIGREVCLARQRFEIGNLPKLILDSLGGENHVGKLLFKGKIIGVDRKTTKGHLYGEVLIEDTTTKDKMRIPFKNENICCDVQKLGSTTWETICVVPDLIAVIDSDLGEAVGTPDFRYGLDVFVLGMAPTDKWTKTERALEIGGPKGFLGFEHLEYKPIGTFVKPMSVIDEFLPKK